MGPTVGEPPTGHGGLGRRPARTEPTGRGPATRGGVVAGRGRFFGARTAWGWRVSERFASCSASDGGVVGCLSRGQARAGRWRGLSGRFASRSASDGGMVGCGGVFQR